MLPWWVWPVLVIVIGLFLWSVISPQSQWRVFQSWAYSNPEANEPSDTAYLLTRIGVIVAIAVILYSIVNLWALA